MKSVKHVCLALAFSVGIGSVVEAADRVALLIGNSRYANKTLTLRNPENDVAALSEKLGALGFVVISTQDASANDMNNALAAFEKQMVGAEMGLFFYAGHGSQAGGENFLIASDFSGSTANSVKSAAVTLSSVREAFQRANPEAGIVILDACRDNPLKIQVGSGDRQIGLARSQGSTGLLIAYATDPGNVAFEGTGDNSIFTTALLKHLAEPGLDVRLMFGRVRQDVVLQTRGAQVPWVEESLIGDHSLNASLDGRGREAAVTRDIKRWREVSSKSTPEPYANYLAEFPEGMFVDFARQRIDRLSAAELTAVATPKEPTEKTSWFDLSEDSFRVADALNILGFAPSPTRTLDIIELETAAAAYEASLGGDAVITMDNLFADASRLLLYLGGSVGKQIQIDIAALSSIDQTLIIANDAYAQMKEIAGDDPEAQPLLKQAEEDIKAIERAQTEVLAQLDQERAYYEELMSRANASFADYMVDRTIGTDGETRSFEQTGTDQTDRAALFLKHVKLEADDETKGTYSWLSDFLPNS